MEYKVGDEDYLSEAGDDVDDLVFYSNDSTVPAGLPNLGNSCYLNALIQALNADEELTWRLWSCNRKVPCNSELLQNYFPKADFYDLSFARRMLVVFEELTIGDYDYLGQVMRDLQLALERVNDMFVPGVQHDSHEALCTVLNAFATLCRMRQVLSPPPQSDAVDGVEIEEAEETEKVEQIEMEQIGDDIFDDFHKDLLTGNVLVTTQCLCCGSEFKRDEPFHFLSVPVSSGDAKYDEKSVPLPKFASPAPHNAAVQLTEGQWSLRDCFGEDELLNGTNKYRCGYCGTLQEARQRRRVNVAPPILIVHLKVFRSEYCPLMNRMVSQKIAGRFPAPHFIPISDVIVEAVDSNLTACTTTMQIMETNDNVGDQVTMKDGYELYAMVMHSGTTTDSGHYYCYRTYESTEVTGKWLVCNDWQVEPVDLDQHMRWRRAATPYLLFYRRKSELMIHRQPDI